MIQNNSEYRHFLHSATLKILSFGWPAPGFSSRTFVGFHEIFSKDKSKVVGQLFRQLLYSLFGENDLVTSHMRCRETALKKKSSTNILYQISVL